MRRKFFALLVAAAVALPVLPAAGLDLLYPVRSLVDLAAGPASDGADQVLNRYSSQTHFDTGGRIASRLQELIPGGLPVLVQAAIDGTFHVRPTVLGVNFLSTGNPYFMPDWNRDGVFGNAPDYTIDNSSSLVSAPFRLPCIADDSIVTWERTDGTCSATGPFKLGEARRVRIVDSRGYLLAATLWLPPSVQSATAPLPAAVFAPGFTSRQADYYAYMMSVARAGLIVLSYDPAGQGDSEGTGFELSQIGSQPTGDCMVPGACRDLQDVVRWLVGDAIVPSAVPASALPRLTPRRNPAYAPAGHNIPNPVRALVDRTRVGLFGQSMGALATNGYLQAMAHAERDAAGKLLPPIRAAVPISGFTKVDRIDVPVQMQTADYDIPGYNETNGIDATDGPIGSKAWYDGHRARRLGSGSLSLIVLESGQHADQSNVPYQPRPLWVLGLSTSYAAAHLACHVAGDAAACASSVAARPHLSRIVASEYDADGPAGGGPSRCIAVPDKGSIAQLYTPDNMLAGIGGTPRYDCVT